MCRMHWARYVRSISSQLHAEVVRVAAHQLPGETPPEQKQRVAKLVQRHSARTKKEKQMRSAIKSGRRAKPS